MAGHRGHQQPDRQEAHTVGHSGALSTVHIEGADNQSDRGPLGHCQLYIQGSWAQRTPTTRQTGGSYSGAHWGTIHKEGTGNQLGEGSWAQRAPSLAPLYAVIEINNIFHLSTRQVWCDFSLVRLNFHISQTSGQALVSNVVYLYIVFCLIYIYIYTHICSIYISERKLGQTLP